MLDKSIKYGNVLESSRADGTLTYTKYVKDEASGKSIKELLDEKVGKTDKLEADQIKDGSVTNAKLEAESVSYDKLQDGSVIARKIKDGNVTTEKVADKNITNPKLGDSSVDTRVLRDGSVTSDIIANDSVTSDKIATQGVTRDKIAEASITLDKLAEELRKLIMGAIGLPEDLIEKIQDINESLQDLQGQINEIVPIENSDIDKVIDGSYVPITPVPSQSIEKRLDTLADEIEGIKKSNMKPEEIEETLT